MAIYNIMKEATEDKKKEKLEEANKFMIFYIMFYGILILIMSVLDFFQRINLSKYDPSKANDGLAFSMVCL